MDAEEGGAGHEGGGGPREMVMIVEEHQDGETVNVTSREVAARPGSVTAERVVVSFDLCERAHRVDNLQLSALVRVAVGKGGQGAATVAAAAARHRVGRAGPVKACVKLGCGHRGCRRRRGGVQR